MENFIEELEKRYYSFGVLANDMDGETAYIKAKDVKELISALREELKKRAYCLVCKQKTKSCCGLGHTQVAKMSDIKELLGGK